MVDALILVGDNLSLTPLLGTGSVRAVVTDPPYGIHYMGEEWDDPRKGHDDTLHPGRRFQQWCERWMRECLRLLRPGGRMACFAAARQVHRVTAAARAAGFVEVETHGWLYLTGHPKFLDLVREIERRGGAGVSAVLRRHRHTALKPAWEPVVVGRRPLVGDDPVEVRLIDGRIVEP